MRILVVTTFYSPAVGGIERLLQDMLPLLAERGHEVEVLTSAFRDAPEPSAVVDGIRVHRIDVLRGLVARDPALVAAGAAAAGRVVDAFAPDLVHAHGIGPASWAVTRRPLACPLVTTLHNVMRTPGGLDGAAVVDGLRVSDWLTGVSRAVIDEAVSIEPSVAHKSSVIVNGVPDSPEPAPPGPARRILAIGRLTGQKGLDVLVRAVPQVLSRQPDAFVTIAGDGGERGTLEALTAELGVERNVRFVGAVAHSQVPALLADSSVIALPSRFEGMPLVALEAGAAGRAIVCTAVPGIDEVVVDGATGLVVPIGDVAALAEALSALLADPARAAALGAAARRRVAKHFSLRTTADAYDALYRRVTAGSSPATLLG